MAKPPEWTPIDDRFPRLFWRLDEAAYEVFARYGMEHDVAEGETVFREGMPTISFFLVMEGELRITSGDREIALIGANHSVGEMALLLDQPRAGTGVATKPTRLLELTRADIQRMQEKEPVWSSRLYRVMAETLAEYLRKVAREQMLRE